MLTDMESRYAIENPELMECCDCHEIVPADSLRPCLECGHLICKSHDGNLCDFCSFADDWRPSGDPCRPPRMVQ